MEAAAEAVGLPADAVREANLYATGDAALCGVTVGENGFNWNLPAMWQSAKARWEVAEGGRRRKYYRITSGGRAQLVEDRRQWQAVDATLRGIWQTLTLPIPGSYPASSGPLPEGA